MNSKPQKDVNHPDDVLNLTNAENTIGDFKLKTSNDYKPSAEMRETTLRAYARLLDTILEVKTLNLQSQNSFSKSSISAVQYSTSYIS